MTNYIYDRVRLKTATTFFYDVNDSMALRAFEKICHACSAQITDFYDSSLVFPCMTYSESIRDNVKSTIRQERKVEFKEFVLDAAFERCYHEVR